MKTRVLLADDHELFREALRMTLEMAPGIQVVAEVGSGEALLTAVNNTNPDVVCMDISMPVLNGIEATQLLRMARPDVRVIGLSAHVDPARVAQMIAAGALGYVIKSDAGKELTKAIDHAIHRQIYLSAALHINCAKELTRFAGSGAQAS